MRIHVHVIPGAKKQSIEKQGTDIYGHEVYKIKLVDKPVDWQANKALIKTLADYFNVRLKNVYIVAWLTSREKLVDIL